VRDDHTNTESTSATIGELLIRVGLLTAGGEPHRSDPLSDPLAFRELTSRLAGIVDRPYDLIVVRDLFGDRVLGYQLALIAEKPVTVSYDREGVIALESAGFISQGSRALIAADVHFSTDSIQAAASGIEQAGLDVSGAAILLQVTRGNYSFPVWALESHV
jgi:hypothetical protein